MKDAAISGATTALGTMLAIFAVYRGVRLDWAETAFVAGVGFLVAGLVIGARVIREITDRCAED